MGSQQAQDIGEQLTRLEQALVKQLVYLLENGEASASDRATATQLLGKAGRLSASGKVGAEKDGWLQLAYQMPDAEFERFIESVRAGRAAAGQVRSPA